MCVSTVMLYIPSVWPVLPPPDREWWVPDQRHQRLASYHSANHKTSHVLSHTFEPEQSSDDSGHQLHDTVEEYTPSSPTHPPTPTHKHAPTHAPSHTHIPNPAPSHTPWPIVLPLRSASQWTVSSGPHSALSDQQPRQPPPGHQVGA